MPSPFTWTSPLFGPVTIVIESRSRPLSALSFKERSIKTDTPLSTVAESSFAIGKVVADALRTAAYASIRP